VYKLVPNPLQVYSYHCDLCLTRVVVCSCSRTWTACNNCSKFSQAGAEGKNFEYIHIWFTLLQYSLLIGRLCCKLKFNSVIGLW